MTHRVMAGSMAVAFLALGAAPAWADYDSDANTCTGGPSVAAQVKLDACTRLIASGQLSAAAMPVAYYNRGVDYMNLGNFAAAISDFDKTIELDPTSEDALYNRGIAHRHLGAYDLALQDYTQAIKLKPDDAEAYNNRGVVYQLMKRNEQALADFNSAIAIDPKHASAYCARGDIEHDMGKTAQGDADLAKGRAIDASQCK